MSSPQWRPVRFSGGSPIARSGSARKPNNYESSLLEFLVDRTGGDTAVIGDRLEAGALRVVRADPTVEDDLHPVDACEARHEVLVEVRAILGDDDEDPHAGSLPRPLRHGVRFLSERATVTLARRLLVRQGSGDMRCE